jgi:uncharacterized RDD family membrane protein YckC
MNEPTGGYQGEPIHGAPYSSAPPQAYGQPHSYGSPQTYGQPVSASPYAYGPPVSAAPQQAGGAALQPYGSAPVPAHHAVPYVPAQAGGYPLVSAGGRIGAALLDGLLMFVTLWIGWLVWAMITWSDGQTPAKKLLGHVVADANTGQPVDWGRMALREFCIKGLLAWVLNLVTFGIYFWVDSFVGLGDRQRTLHDRMANSIVRHV